MATDPHLAIKATIEVDGEAYRVLSYVLREGLFEVSSLECQVVKDDALAPEAAHVIGKNAVLKLARADGEASRAFAGIVIAAEQRHSEDDVLHTRLVIAPKLWQLGKRADCRTF